MRNGICPKCESTQLLHDIPIIDRNETGDKPLSIKLISPTPHKFLGIPLENAEYIPLALSMCGACGYSEAYCADLPKMKDLLQQGWHK